MEKEYQGFVAALRTESPDLAAEVGSFRGLEDVLKWMQPRGLTRAAIDLIGMDEFHYDFLIQLEKDSRWISFGVT